MGQVFSLNNLKDGASTTNSDPPTKKRKRTYVKRTESKACKDEREKQKQNLFLSFLFHLQLQQIQALNIVLPQVAGVKQVTECDEEVLLNYLASQHNCVKNVKYFVWSCYKQWKDARDHLYAYFTNTKQKYSMLWDPEVANKSHAEFWKQGLQLLLSKKYATLHKWYLEEVEILLEMKYSMGRGYYTTVRLLDLCNLYQIICYQGLEETQLTTNGDFVSQNKLLSLVLFECLYLICKKDICIDFKNILSAFDCLTPKFVHVVDFCKEVETGDLEHAVHLQLMCEKMRLFESWEKDATIFHLTCKKTHNALLFYESMFNDHDLEYELRLNIRLLRFFLNPSEQLYNEVRNCCATTFGDPDWSVTEKNICEQLTILFKNGVDLVFGKNKAKKVIELFVLCHKMNVNILDRYELLENILKRFKTFLPREIEQLCYSYLQNWQPKTQYEIEMMKCVVYLLSKTGLKCRDEAIALLEEPEEEEVNASGPKTRIQTLEAMIREMKATRRENLSCPIGYHTMFDPVTLKCGHAFARYNIERHFRQSWHRNCPTCRATHFAYVNENHKLRSMALPYLEKHHQRFQKILSILKDSMQDERDVLLQEEIIEIK